MSTNPHVTEHAINQAKCAAWIMRIQNVNTERDIKQTLLDLLRAGNYAEFKDRRQTLLGDNHGQGFTWKPRFLGFWKFINTLFSWLFGEHKPGSPLFRALEPKIVYTPPEPLPVPENLEALLEHHQYYTPADFHQHLKAFAKTSPQSFIANYTSNWDALPEAGNDYRFLYMDVLVECLLKTTMPGNVLEQKAYVLQELLLALAADATSLPETYQKLQQQPPKPNNISNLELLERRLTEIPKSHMHPLVEHVARRGVEMLLLALPLTDEGKNEHLHEKSPFCKTIALLCTRILSIRSPELSEEQFAHLTAPVFPATPFGDYKYVSHGAFTLSLAFIRGGIEGALWTFFDAVNRRVIATEQQRAFVIARLQDIPERLVHTKENLLRLLDIIKTTPLNPMSGTQKEIEDQIKTRIEELLSPSSACSSSTAPNDCCSARALHGCGTFASPQSGTPPHTDPTPEAPGTEVPERGCQPNGHLAARG
ncbi:hypothetical protein Lgee_1261 [Legionella geestiana]|uniref:Uncharacterized protein n=1 Tax=Legionella geestiana TaxID=45065 RepID=A0A0W0TTA9_9GAMM|nr:hypothetical protein [Legionella geestiana]KTC98995.1 hypothetical protein Lgee_1261 [Legionella geestiana]QBS12670.1 hypothetical protein E4T54_07890 [Legionella geestiana]STX54867.1 Uncharacterised protein [Legionella geestiana]